jgi:hypothetical protein
MKRGRPTILKDPKKNLNEFKAFYLSHGESLKETAKFFRISNPTLRKYLRQAKVVLKRHGAMPDPNRGYIPEKALLFKWLRENPTVRLPKSIKKISDLTGINYPCVKMYLYRRRDRLVKWLKRQGSLEDSLVVLKDLHGRVFPCRALKDFDLTADKFDSTITLTARLKSTEGKIIFRISLSTYLQELRTLGRLQTSQDPFVLEQTLRLESFEDSNHYEKI